MPKAEESGHAQVNDIQMYYAVFGKGEAATTCSTAASATPTTRTIQVPAFAEHYQVIVADGRGHSRGTPSGQPYSYQLMAWDLLTLMDHLKIGKAAIVDWSDGSIIGLDLAMNHPERLTRLFAFGANYNVGGLRDDIDARQNLQRLHRPGRPGLPGDWPRRRTSTTPSSSRSARDVELPSQTTPEPSSARSRSRP